MNEPSYQLSPTQESFRSRGETQIARCLTHCHIPYFYEHPLAVLDEGKTRVWYPDFQLPGYGVLIEYCGVVGDEHYDRGTRKKEQVYQANGLDCLFWTPPDFKGDWPERLRTGIEQVLADRLTRFRETRPREYSNHGLRAEKTYPPESLIRTFISGSSGHPINLTYALNHETNLEFPDLFKHNPSPMVGRYG